MKILLMLLLFLIPSCGNVRPMNEWSAGVAGQGRDNRICADRAIELAREATGICELAYKIGNSIQYKRDCLHKYNEVKHYLATHKSCGIDSEDYREWRAVWSRLNAIFQKCVIPKNWG